ncbi:MAG: hypothetical protein Tsb005_15470 [Gammaproteobacteria bacterium]
MDGIAMNYLKNRLALTAICGMMLAYITLNYLSHQLTSTLTDPALTLYLSASAVNWILWGILLYSITNEQASNWSLSQILIIALGVRLFSITTAPLVTTDYFRYLWDGFHFAQFGSPYLHAPAMYFDDLTLPDVIKDLLADINYPSVPTIYGPTLQYIFLLAYWLKPVSLLTLKIIFIIFDLISIRLLARIAQPRWVLAYALCPLLIMEISVNAHADIIGATLLLASCVYLRRTFVKSSAICLALAIGAKLIAVVVAPFILLKLPKRTWNYFALTLLILYCPFILLHHTEFAALQQFLSQWEFNSSGFAVLKLIVDAQYARYIAALLIMISAIWYGYRYQHRYEIPRGDWLLGIFFLLAPVLNPWYYIWLLPFAALYPSLWAWAGAALIALSYVNGEYSLTLQLAPFHHPEWLRPLEFLPILLLVIYEKLRRPLK